jgi:hypothetical protein
VIYAVIAEAIIIVTLIALIYSLERSNAQERSDRADAYERTLQTMADRVQAPDRLPIRETADFELPEREPDEWNKVGELVIDDDYGLTDDDG